MNFRRPMLCLLALLAVSCANKKPAEPPVVKPLGERLNESNGYKQDSSGNWVPQVDKRSSFESQGQSPYFNGTYGKSTYQTGDYAKKSWWGNKSYGTQSYSGSTDGSRFQKSSDLGGKGAREAGNAADVPGNYQTGNYATGAAREAGAKGIANPGDRQADVRRKLSKEPEIVDWKAQRSLSLEQSKGILGH